MERFHHLVFSVDDQRFGSMPACRSNASPAFCLIDHHLCLKADDDGRLGLLDDRELRAQDLDGARFAAGLL